MSFFNKLIAVCFLLLGGHMSYAQATLEKQLKVNKLQVYFGAHMYGHNQTGSSVDSVIFGIERLGDGIGTQIGIKYRLLDNDKFRSNVNLNIHWRYFTYYFYNSISAQGLPELKVMTSMGTFYQPSIDIGYKTIADLEFYGGLAFDINNARNDNSEPFNNRGSTPVGDEQIEVVGNQLVRAIKPFALHYKLGLQKDLGRFSFSAEYVRSITNILDSIEVNGEQRRLNLKTAYIFFNLGYYIWQKKDEGEDVRN